LCECVCTLREVDRQADCLHLVKVGGLRRGRGESGLEFKDNG